MNELPEAASRMEVCMSTSTMTAVQWTRVSFFREGSRVVFQPGETNRGLYLRFDPGVEVDLEALTRYMRDADLWESESEPKVVEGEGLARYAGADDLECKDVQVVRVCGCVAYIACFNHEKFPPSATQWQKWRQHFSDTVRTA